MAGVINPLKLKASDIRAAMQKRWTDPEWAIMWEVAEGTGAGAGRYADAIMMSLWPSRGLELHGVEIKISRSDWKREAADPTKAESIAKFCDRWWIHTPENVVDDVSDIPPAWGLREWTGKQWRTVKEAEKTEAQPISRHFLAALLRRADGIMKSMMEEARIAANAELHDKRTQQQEQFQRVVNEEVERRTRDFESLKKQIEILEEAFGCEINGYSPDMSKIGRAAYALSQADQPWLQKRADLFQNAADAIRELQSICSPSDEAA